MVNEIGFSRNLSLVDYKLAEALSSLRNTDESVVSAGSRLENRENAATRYRVHPHIANITPDRRARGGSLYDVRRPIEISVWQNENLEMDRQISSSNNPNRGKEGSHGEAVTHSNLMIKPTQHFFIF